MNEARVVWLNPRPMISVVPLGQQKLSRCYYESKYKIISTSRLSKEKLLAFYKAGMFGFGQSFFLLSEASGNEKPAGEDLVYPKVVKNEEVVNDNPKNCFGDNIQPIMIPYYEYIIAYRVDSSD